MHARLRQVALVARELEPRARALTETFGLSVAYRDPGVEEFGLHNVVVPVGDTFLEIVSPLREDTSAGRLLERRGGDGGYMAIFEIASDAASERARMGQLGVRVVWEVELEDIATLHLHPRDVGGAIVSLDFPRPHGAWRWGGPEWREHARTERVREIAGVTVQAEDPAAMAARWAAVLGVEVQAGREGTQLLELDAGPLRPEGQRGPGSGGVVRFVPIRDERGEGVWGVTFEAGDWDAALESARAQGLEVDGATLSLCGTRFEAS